MFASPLDNGFRIALGLELGLVSASVREEGQCIANCEYAAGSYVEHGTSTVGLASTSLIPSYRVGNWVGFASGTLRNHPTNTDKQRLGAWADDRDDELRSGPLYILVGAGLEYRDPSGMTVLGQVYQPISTGVVQYGPAAGFSVGFELGTLGGDGSF